LKEDPKRRGASNTVPDTRENGLLIERRQRKDWVALCIQLNWKRGLPASHGNACGGGKTADDGAKFHEKKGHRQQLGWAPKTGTKGRGGWRADRDER